MTATKDLVIAVNGLTTETTNLLDTVTSHVDKSEALFTEASRVLGIANTSVTQSASSASSAKSSATNADKDADRADKAADSAVAVVTGGTASLVAAAGKIPIANGDGHIDKDYLGIYIKDSYRHAVESATGGKNTVLYDTHGNANVMVVIPKFTYDEIGMTDTMGVGVATAFMRSGDEIPEIFIAKYLGSGSQGASVANADPRTSVNYDQAKGICEAKGTGWHLMTMHEWAAISLWCMANNHQPRGNTQYGRAHDALHEFGRRGDGRSPNDRNGSARTNSGSSPASWAHDGTDAGVYDLVGNVWEWMYGLKIQDGQVICTPDNEFTTLEAQWISQECFFDNPLKLNSQVTSAGSVNTEWKGLTSDESYVSNELMKRLLIEPTGLAVQGRLYANNEGERLPIRGGIWYGGSDAGLAALSLNNARSYAYSRIGFRPAFVA